MKKKPKFEKLARVQHEIWIHWMKYLFSVSTMNPDGSYTIPKEKVDRWNRLINTPYKNLTEDEKESDREQAQKIIDIVIE